MIWILFIGTMALSLWAMWRVQSVATNRTLVQPPS
jgi:hypothetical protein